MAPKQNFSNNYLLAVIFLHLFVFCDLASMDPGSLLGAIEGRTPLHIVTLTRTTCNRAGNVLLDKYLPISAAEAVTIFAITNAFLGGQEKPDEIINAAYKFDDEQFQIIDKQFNGENRQAALTQILERELRSIKGLEETLIQRIVFNKDGVTFRAVLSQDGDTILEMKLDLINRTDIKNSINSGVSGDKFVPKQTDKIKGTINFIVEVEGKQWKVSYANILKIREIIELLKENADAQLKEKYFSKDPFLFGYLGLEDRGVKYYKQLYSQVVNKALSEYCLPKTELCLLVANELFFGKDFILPDNYPSLIPAFPNNVLACINFLLKSPSKPSGTVFASELSDWSSVEDLPRWIHTMERWPQNEGNPFFRSVSFYRIGNQLVQEYSKASYYQECDLALKNGYTYLFGQRLDCTIDTDFTGLISTQICYDLQSKIRTNQHDIPAPIHIFQSNTHELVEVLSRSSNASEPSKEDIPGEPKIIIHADPKNQELFVKYEEKCFSWMENSAEEFELTDPSSKTHYTAMPPRGSFTFSISKEDRVDSYTITHWMLK